MLSDNAEHKKNINKNLQMLLNIDLMPRDHVLYLESLNISPKVIYDIGSAVLHWTRHAERIWNGSEIILFDAFEPLEWFYDGYKYHIGVLAEKDDRVVKYHCNDEYFGGNSIYKEDNDKFFPKDNYVIRNTRCLDSVVKEKGFPYPDLIKIDVQGAELDLLRGAQECLKNAKWLIIELQHVQYNLDAPLATQTISYLESIGWKCISPKFCINPSGADADYAFINTLHKDHQTI